MDENEANTSAASHVYNQIYKRLIFSFDIPQVAKKTLDILQNEFQLSLPIVKQVSTAFDPIQNRETTKFLLKFEDDQEVETVLIPFEGKYTLCISSQVGCGMACSFCFTGTQGLTRNLSTDEIVGQLLTVKKFFKEKGEDRKITNLVFMGQGEPLHNFKAVRKACDVFLSQHGLSLGREKITISTAGYLPGLIEWVENPLPVNLALSFHCPDDEIRSKLIPLNKGFPLKDVLEAISKIPLEKKRFNTFEVLLIKDLNDSEEFAERTVQLVKELNPIINIIPFNPFPGTDFERPLDENLDRFKAITEGHGIPTMIRKTKGDAILAACGQLKS